MYNKSSTFEAVCKELGIENVPKRSVYSPLKPVGVGTPFVESLTSYLTRLAENHCVNVLDIILDVTGSERTVTNQYGKSLNRNSNLSELVIEQLRMKTGVVEIGRLTLAGWDFIDTGVLRYSKAWCPICFFEWGRLKQPLYEPLLWFFKIIDICVIHNVKLQDRCPHCDKAINFLYKMGRIGYCPLCSKSLAIDPLSLFTPFIFSEEEVMRQKFIIRNVGEIIQNNHNLKTLKSELSLSTLLDRIIEERYDNNLAEFARDTKGMPSKLWAWRKKENKPQLYSIIWVATLFNTTVYKLIEGYLPNRVSINKKVNGLFKPRRALPMLHTRIIEVFEKALNESPPPTLAQVAERVPCSRGYLRNKYPDYTTRITSRSKSKNRL